MADSTRAKEAAIEYVKRECLDPGIRYEDDPDYWRDDVRGFIAGWSASQKRPVTDEEVKRALEVFVCTEKIMFRVDEGSMRAALEAARRAEVGESDG